MIDAIERRIHPRYDTLITRVYMSSDQRQWQEIETKNISAEGVAFLTKSVLEVHIWRYFNLYIYNMLSEFSMKVEGQVIRTEKIGKEYLVIARFRHSSKNQHIQLDELLQSQVSLCDPIRHCAMEDEVFTLMLATNHLEIE